VSIDVKTLEEVMERAGEGSDEVRAVAEVLKVLAIAPKQVLH